MHQDPKSSATGPVGKDLQEEAAFFRQLMETLPDKIYFKDLESRFLRISRAQAAQFGLNHPREAVGRSDFDFFTRAHARTARAEEEEIIRTGRPLVNNEQQLFLADGTEKWASTTKVPLRDAQGEIVGTMGVSRDITDKKRAEEELRRKDEQMWIDLRMACKVQESFLTLKYPEIRYKESCLCFHHRYLPAASLAGDFFKIFQVSESEAGIFICDVMGHGVRAALITAFLRGLLGERLPSAAEPGAFLREINQDLIPILSQTDSPMFVTAVYAVADIARGEIRFANAGHPAPFLLRRKEGALERMAAPAADPEPALGLMESFHYSVGKKSFRTKDVALFLTDGLYEVANGDGQFFEEERLQSVLRNSLSLDTDPLLNRLTSAAKEHAGCDLFPDDVCIVATDFCRDGEKQAR